MYSLGSATGVVTGGSVGGSVVGAIVGGSVCGSVVGSVKGCVVGGSVGSVDGKVLCSVASTSDVVGGISNSVRQLLKISVEKSSAGIRNREMFLFMNSPPFVAIIAKL